MVDTIDLSREARLGIDRVTLRLTRANLAQMSKEMENIIGDATDLATMLVANARAQERIRRDFPAGQTIQGTGIR